MEAQVENLYENLHYECAQLRDQNVSKSKMVKDLGERLQEIHKHARHPVDVNASFGVLEIPAAERVMTFASRRPEAVDASAHPDAPFHDAQSERGS